MTKRATSWVRVSLSIGVSRRISAIAKYLGLIDEWTAGLAELKTTRDLALEVDDRDAVGRFNARLREFTELISEQRDDWALNRLPILKEGDLSDSERAGLEEISNRLDALRFGEEAASRLRSHLNESMHLTRTPEAFLGRGREPVRLEAEVDPELLERASAALGIDEHTRLVESALNIPVSKGGSNTARNIELRCEACNRKKAASI